MQGSIIFFVPHTIRDIPRKAGRGNTRDRQKPVGRHVWQLSLTQLRRTLKRGMICRCCVDYG